MRVGAWGSGHLQSSAASLRSLGRAGSDSSKAAEPWEGAPVPSEVHRGWDVSEAGRGFGPTGNLGKLCLPKGEWGQPPKSVKQRCDIR